MKRSTILRGTALLAFPVLALTACTSQATAPGGDDDGSATGSLRVTGFSGAFADQFEELVLEPFSQETGIEVTYTPATNSAEILAGLRANTNQPTYDLVVMDSSVATSANEEGLFAELDLDLFDAYDELVPEAVITEGYGPAVTIDSLTMAYNPGLIDAPPETWAGLADPEYDGEIALQIADTRGIALIAGLSKELGLDYEDGIDDQLAVMADIAQNAQTYEPQPNVYDAIRSGSVAIGLGWNARTQALSDETPDEIASFVPEGGGVAQISTLNLVSTSANPDEAQQLIDYAIGAEAQSALAEAGYYGPVNSTVTLPDDITPRVAVDGGLMTDAATIDWAWIAPHYAEWVERIQREVLIG